MKMPVIGLIQRAIGHQVEAMTQLAKTFEYHGIRTRTSYVERGVGTAPESVVVCWSWGKGIQVREKNPTAIILCCDHGYTPDRKRLVNTGWSVPGMHCGLNGWAEHAMPGDDGGERWRHMGWDRFLQPGRQPRGRNALLLGQVFGDAAIHAESIDYGGWLRMQAESLQKDGWTVRFRPHPVMVRRGNVRAYGPLPNISTHSLEEDLAWADRAVGLNSNAVLEAYLAGVPECVVYSEGSMMAHMCGPRYGLPAEGGTERREFFHRLAYTQWTPEELGNGTWAEYHLPILRRLLLKGECRPWNQS